MMADLGFVLPILDPIRYVHFDVRRISSCDALRTKHFLENRKL
jgi:hypothetical protein